jgi:hypothetical protein
MPILTQARCWFTGPDNPDVTVQLDRGGTQTYYRSARNDTLFIPYSLLSMRNSQVRYHCSCRPSPTREHLHVSAHCAHERRDHGEGHKDMYFDWVLFRAVAGLPWTERCGLNDQASGSAERMLSFAGRRTSSQYEPPAGTSRQACFNSPHHAGRMACKNRSSCPGISRMINYTHVNLAVCRERPEG